MAKPHRGGKSRAIPDKGRQNPWAGGIFGPPTGAPRQPGGARALCSFVGSALVGSAPAQGIPAWGLALFLLVVGG
jgi:hypothetical protein